VYGILNDFQSIDQSRLVTIISFSVIGTSIWNRPPPSARVSFLSSNLSTFLNYPFLKLVHFLGANRTKSVSVDSQLLRGAICRYSSTMQYKNTIQYKNRRKVSADNR